MDQAREIERRAAPRQRTFLAGTARHQDGLAAMDCTVRELSDQGARLEGADPRWFPRRFELAVTARALRRSAQVIWRGERGVGVRFIDAAPGHGLQAEVERLQDEKRRLLNRLRDLTS